jgi:hypothetical protein
MIEYAVLRGEIILEPMDNGFNQESAPIDFVVKTFCGEAQIVANDRTIIANANLLRKGVVVEAWGPVRDLQNAGFPFLRADALMIIRGKKSVVLGDQKKIDKLTETMTDRLAKYYLPWEDIDEEDIDTTVY